MNLIINDQIQIKGLPIKQITWTPQKCYYLEKEKKKKTKELSRLKESKGIKCIHDFLLELGLKKKTCKELDGDHWGHLNIVSL